jgi:hypothetical protein
MRKEFILIGLLLLSLGLFIEIGYPSITGAFIGREYGVNQIRVGWIISCLGIPFIFLGYARKEKIYGGIERKAKGLRSNLIKINQILLKEIPYLPPKRGVGWRRPHPSDHLDYCIAYVGGILDTIRECRKGEITLGRAHSNIKTLAKQTQWSLDRACKTMDTILSRHEFKFDRKAIADVKRKLRKGRRTLETIISIK